MGRFVIKNATWKSIYRINNTNHFVRPISLLNIHMKYDKSNNF